MNPAMMIEAIGSATIEAIDSRLLQGLGFSKGWVELGPKNPPPLVPACLIATSAATGPRGGAWPAPSSVVPCAAPWKVIGTPAATSRTEMTRAAGSRTATSPRIRSR